jgi:hypothetical protein
MVSAFRLQALDTYNHIIYIHIYEDVYLHTLYTCECVSVCVCVCVCVYENIYACMYVCIYICMHVCM